MPSLTVYLSSRSCNQASHLLIFTHAPLSSSHKYPLSNISPAFSRYLERRCLWWAQRGKSVPISWTSVLFLLYFCVCMCECVCECVRACLSLPASLSNAFFSVSSRCVLSHQACQTLTFRRCLLLDTIARLPEPEGKRHFPSLSTSISQSHSPSAISSCHLQRRPSSRSAAGKTSDSKKTWMAVEMSCFLCFKGITVSDFWSRAFFLFVLTVESFVWCYSWMLSVQFSCT